MFAFVPLVARMQPNRCDRATRCRGLCAAINGGLSSIKTQKLEEGRAAIFHRLDPRRRFARLRARRPRTTLPVPSGSSFLSAPPDADIRPPERVAEGLSRGWHQRVVGGTRPGGGRNIGRRGWAEAAPDGYTMWVLSSEPMVYNQFAFKNLPFDPEKDFEPISLLFFNTLALV